MGMASGPAGFLGPKLGGGQETAPSFSAQSLGWKKSPDRGPPVSAAVATQPQTALSTPRVPSPQSQDSRAGQTSPFAEGSSRTSGLALVVPTFCLVGGGNAHWPDGVGPEEGKAYSRHAPQNHTRTHSTHTQTLADHTPRICTHTHTLAVQHTRARKANIQGHVGTSEAQTDAKGPPTPRA